MTIIERHLLDLAILGGQPAFAQQQHVGRPNIGDRARLMERINDILDRRWLTNNGPYVQEFERQVAELAGVRQCVAMCNATVALEIAIRAMGMEGEVIVPSFTFVATAHALQWQQIRPVFCDVHPDSWTLDPAQVEAAITPRTTGIIGLHLWGRPCDTAALAAIAERHGLQLLYDAAHAFGCSHEGRMIGGFGRAEVFSFHATKFCNSFEGGAVVTDNDELAERMRLMRNFGFAGYDRVDYVGTNGKMSEVAAAMGLTSIESLDEFVAINQANYRLYDQLLADTPGIQLFRYDERERCNYQYLAVELDAAVTGISRDELVAVLWAENVLARRYFAPGVHQMEPYRSLDPEAGRRLPITERLNERVLVLPTGTAMSPDDVALVCELIRCAVANGPELAQLLRERQAR